MHKFVILIIAIAVAVLGAGIFYYRSSPAVNTSVLLTTTMFLTSSAFNSNERIPAKFTCDSDDINPELLIANVPKNTRSLALIVDDPDAPRGTFTHWLVWNISPDTQIIKQESTLPGSSEGVNDANKIGYIGPCPPAGTHRYFFRLYALDARLDLPSGTGKQELEIAIAAHLLAKTELIGTYSRPIPAP